MIFSPIGMLKNVSLFTELSLSDCAEIAEQLKEHTFPAGAAVTKEGEPGPSVLAFFVIVDGRATVTVGGQEKATLGPGDHLGELSLIYDVPRSATVTADTDLHCYALSAWEFRPFVESHPKIAWAMLKGLAKRLGDQAFAPGKP